MLRNIILFDMDGVLLTPGGYHESLKASVKRIGKALGVPNVELRHDQIARFESLSVTNEWDSLAICTALMLTHVWKQDENVRLTSLEPFSYSIVASPPNFDEFLYHFTDVGDLPGHRAYDIILDENPHLNLSQREYLSDILHKCRDIYHSATLPAYQETVLGSEVFHKTYGLEPQIGIESYLLQHDRPILTPENLSSLQEWLLLPTNAIGIMTNRPCLSPDGYISSPEAELGAQLIGLDRLPLLGSSMLAWYAQTCHELPRHTYFKPHPVHALALLSMCTGTPIRKALEHAVSLTNHSGDVTHWSFLDQTRIFIFEDSVKGLESGLLAKELLSELGIHVELSLIGVSNQPVKRLALKKVADNVLSDINDLDWQLL
jgi:hypothetical protein